MLGISENECYYKKLILQKGIENNYNYTNHRDKINIKLIPLGVQQRWLS